MGNKSVPALPLSRNDVSCLAQTIHVAFEYFCTHNSPFCEDYTKTLSVIVGLGFTIVLVDGDFIPTYQDHLQVFLSYRKFTEHPERLVALSLAIAEMISLSAYLFCLFDYPGYYDYFAEAVEKAVNGSLSGIHGSLEKNQRSRIKAVLAIIAPKLH